MSKCSLGHAQYILWVTDPDRCFFLLLEEKNKIKIYLLAVVGKFGLFPRYFDYCLTENLPAL